MNDTITNNGITFHIIRTVCSMNHNYGYTAIHQYIHIIVETMAKRSFLWQQNISETTTEDKSGKVSSRFCSEIGLLCTEIALSYYSHYTSGQSDTHCAHKMAAISRSCAQRIYNVFIVLTLFMKYMDFQYIPLVPKIDVK